MSKGFRKLKAYRTMKGINQKELGEMLGISLYSYNHKENGKSQFTLEEAKKISEFFNVSIDEIFFSDSVHAGAINF